MKTILAMALVGLLSISSLANQDPPDLSNELLPPDISCPAEYEIIKGNSKIKDFCITKSVQTKMRHSLAIENCKKHVHDGTAFLCGSDEWFLACKKNGKQLKMGKDHDRDAAEWIEWVSDNGRNFSQVMDNSDCNSFSIIDIGGLFGSRCCYR